MIVIRPVSQDDHKEILALAREAGIGMTSLPPDENVLRGKIARSVASVKGAASHRGDEGFLFVLEDTKTKKLVGTTGIIAHVGIRYPFYSYKLSTIVQASEELGIYSMQRVLHMVNDYTGAAEVGSLFLLPDYRRDGIGRFLSRCRYLFMAEFGDVFGDIVISEIRGVQNEEGESPFYKNLAQHFFQMDFKHADFINATQGSQFISDLMPKYPIYVNLLDTKAQAVVGKPFAASRPAMQLLEAEGFRHQGYIDVFDAGPTMQAERLQIRSIKNSRRAKITEIKDVPAKPVFLISNTKKAEFRATMGGIVETPEGISVSADVAGALGAKKGDFLRFIEA